MALFLFLFFFLSFLSTLGQVLLRLVQTNEPLLHIVHHVSPIHFTVQLDFRVGFCFNLLLAQEALLAFMPQSFCLIRLTQLDLRAGFALTFLAFYYVPRFFDSYIYTMHQLTETKQKAYGCASRWS